MRTLKKVLALSLVLAMAFAMLAGAVYTDNTSVTDKDEVQFVSGLGIMKGYPDGSFKPANSITRAEAAKMVYVSYIGSDTGASNYASMNTFSDVPASHWAAGYINALAAKGIIAGVGDKLFDPEGKVTGLALVKMLLVLKGYNATKSGLVGSQWAINVMNLGLENDLFEGYGLSLDSNADRNGAAVLFYNTLWSDMVKWSNDAEDYEVLGDTVAEKYFDLEEHEGVLLAADLFTLDADVGEDVIAVDEDEDGVIDADEKFDFEGGRDLVGQTVKVLYDDKNDEVYAVVPSEDAVVYNVTLGDIDKVTTEATQIKFGGKYYKLNTEEDDAGVAVKIFENYEEYDVYADHEVNGIPALLDINSGNPVRIIDTDGDGDLDLFFVTTRTFAYVDDVDSKSISFDGQTEKFLNSDGDTVVYADGIVEGDYVYYWVDELGTDDIYYLTKATSVTAEIEAVQSDNTTIYINGASKSKVKAGVDFITAVGDIDEATITAPATGDTCQIFLDGKYYIASIAEDDVATAGNYAYVLEAANEDTDLATGHAPKVSVLLPGEDGATDYELNEDSKVFAAAWDKHLGADVDDFDDDDNVAEEDPRDPAQDGAQVLTTVNFSKITAGAAGVAEDDLRTAVVGRLFAYEIKSDGSILLTQDMDNYSTSAEFKYDEDADIFTARGAAPVGSNGDYLLADDAVIFYLWDVSEAANEDGWKVYGAGDFDTTFDTDIGDNTDDASVLAYTTSGGFKYITAAVMVNDVDKAKQGGGESDDMYGFLTSKPVLGTDADDVDYVKYTVWTNGASKTYYEMDTHTINTGVDRKDFVKFNLNSNGEIKEASLDDGVARGAFGGIDAYSSKTGKITIDGSLYNITEDTVTDYVDYDAVAGGTGSGYPKLSLSDEDDGYDNCYYVLGAAGTDEAFDVLYICIDTGASVGVTMKP